MNKEEFKENEEEFLAEFRKIGSFKISENQILYTGLLILVCKLLYWIMKLLWSIYLEVYTIRDNQDIKGS